MKRRENSVLLKLVLKMKQKCTLARAPVTNERCLCKCVRNARRIAEKHFELRQFFGGSTGIELSKQRIIGTERDELEPLGRLGQSLSGLHERKMFLSVLERKYLRSP